MTLPPMATDQRQDPLIDVELKELGRISWSAAEKQPFLKCVQWSPDGTALLTAVNGQGMKVIDLPSDLLQTEAEEACE